MPEEFPSEQGLPTSGAPGGTGSNADGEAPDAPSPGNSGGPGELLDPSPEPTPDSVIPLEPNNGGGVPDAGAGPEADAGAEANDGGF